MKRISVMVQGDVLTLADITHVDAAIQYAVYREYEVLWSVRASMMAAVLRSEEREIG